MKNYASKDYYKILGLNYDAKPEDIKKAFRRATVKYHPDVNPNGEKIFMEIKEAYEVLIDENERKNYDFIKGYDVLKRQKQQKNRKPIQVPKVFRKNTDKTPQIKNRKIKNKMMKTKKLNTLKPQKISATP